MPVLRLLGEGAFARVYLVSEEKEKRAAKLLLSAGPEAVALFKQEFLLGKNLCHPSLVRFYRFGWTEETPFYTMEYLQGEELKNLWPKLDFAARKLLCYQLFLGLTLLHKRGLVHRDLKPSNLFVVRRTKGAWQLKIMDLGLAQSSERREEGNIGGTVDYLAPEVINNEKADARSDFYSCGIILAELFLGRPPFADPDPAVTLARHQEAELPPLPIRNAREKNFWEGLIGRLAAKNREERPASGEEILSFLLEDQALKAKVSSRPEGAGGWCRTLLPRFWTAAPPGAPELRAEIPQSVLRAKEELQDWNDLEKKAFAPAVRLGLEPTGSQAAYPRLSVEELQNWLASNFAASREVSEILWGKTCGDVSLVEMELGFWQKKKIVTWDGSRWKWNETGIRDIPLSPSSQKEFLTLAATLPAEEGELLSKLSPFLESFKPEEAEQARLWPKQNLRLLLKNLLEKNFLSAGDAGLTFSRPGLREALYLQLKNRAAAHRQIWDCLTQSGQLENKDRATEAEFQAAGAGLWKEAIRLALSIAEAESSRENFKTAFWYLCRAGKWLKKMPKGAERGQLEASVCKSTGNFFGQQGEVEKAIAEYTALVKLTQKLKDRQAEADAYNRLGNHYRQKPDYKKAGWALNKALHLFEILGLELKQAYVHNNLGATYAHQLRYEEALAHYNKAAETHRRLGAVKSLATTVNNIGATYYLWERLAEAARYFREALELNRRLGEKEEIARCLNNIGLTLIDRGDFEEALPLLLEAQKLNRQTGNKKDEINNLDNLAVCRCRTGHHSDAVAYALEALEISEKIAYRGNHPTILCSLAKSLKAQGQYVQAQKYFAEAQNAARELKDRAAEALILVETADLFLCLNFPNQAEKTTMEALDLAQKTSLNSVKARLLALSGKLEARKGNFPEAEKKFAEAEKLLAGSERKGEQLEIALQRSEALGFGVEALVADPEHSRRAADPERLVPTCSEQGRVKRAEGSREEAGRKIQELLEHVRAFSQEALSRPQNCEKLYLEAASMLASGQAPQARAKAVEALKLACELNEPEKIWRLHHLLGKSWLEEKNYQKVFGELKAAAEVLDGLRKNFSSEENLARYFDDPQKTELLAEIQKVAQALGQ